MTTFSTTNLSVVYDTGTHALRGVDVSFEEGTTTAIVGPNGCGKSTLLRCLARLQPYEGTVNYKGKDAHGLRRREMARSVAMLPQNPIAPEGLSVRQLVSRGRDPHRTWYSRLSVEDEAAIDRALEVTGLEKFAEQDLEDLSGGQRQRAWIAMTLAQDCETVLLDEPINHLDISYQLDILETLKTLRTQHAVSIIIVLHDLNLAARYADNVVVMSNGQVVASGPARETLNAETIGEVFAVDADVFSHHLTGEPIVYTRPRAAGRKPPIKA